MTSLSRLATDSGGRLTEMTNDLTLGYARAQRDLRCTYSVGFYLPEGIMDRPQNLSVKVLRPGLRAIHPSKYIFRSEEAKAESRLKAAWAAPEMFQSGVVRAHVFPLRPASKKAWETMLAVSFPVPLAEEQGRPVTREFGAVLRKGPDVVHKFNRSITVVPRSPNVPDEPFLTFLESVDLKPGEYELTTVLADPDDPDPQAVRINLELPEITRRELLLVGPVLGQPAGPNVVVMGGDVAETDEVGDRNSFQPLIVHQLDGPVDLVSLTQACMVSKRQRRTEAMTIDRSLREVSGSELGGLEALQVALEGEEPVRCQNVVDVLPAQSLGNGEYVFEAQFNEGKDESGPRGAVRFAISAGAGTGGGS